MQCSAFQTGRNPPAREALTSASGVGVGQSLGPYCCQGLNGVFLKNKKHTPSSVGLWRVLQKPHSIFSYENRKWIPITMFTNSDTWGAL